MSQIEVPKAVMTAAIGSDSVESSASKVVMTAVLTPSDEDDGSYRAVHIQTRIIRRN